MRDKEVAQERIRALALVKASIRMNSAPLTAARGRAQAASRSGTRRTERAAPARSGERRGRSGTAIACGTGGKRPQPGRGPDTAPKPAPSNRGTANRCREGLGTGPPAARPQSETRRNVPQRRAANDKSHEKAYTAFVFTYLCRNFFEYGRRNIIQSNLLFMEHTLHAGGNSRAYTAPRMETPGGIR